jgi:nucleoside-diphosphate-sugar epimerase
MTAPKHAGEEYSRVFSSLYGLSTVCLLYFTVYGPRLDPHSDYAAAVPRFIQRIWSGEPPQIYGDGKQTRDFVYVKDVVQADTRAMSPLNASRVYNIAKGIGISVNDLAAIVLRVLGSEMQPVYAEARSGEVKHSVADVSKARREFMFNPGYTLEKGLEEMVMD